MSINFDDVVLPSRLAFGIDCIVEMRVDVTRLASGYEHRNTRWSKPRRRYALSIDQRPVAEVRELLAFFEARHGPLNAFKFSDPMNNSTQTSASGVTAQDVILGEGDGMTTEFALRDLSDRFVVLPDPASVVVAIDGQTLNGGYQVNTGGRIVFDMAPLAGTVVTAGCIFFIPVRFENEELVATRTTNATAQIAQIDLVEVYL